MLRTLLSSLVLYATLVGAPASALTINVDGLGPEGGYGAARRVPQTCNTSAGNNPSGGDNRHAMGSELNVSAAAILNATVYAMYTGNLQSNFTNLEVFIDCIAGGQNTLRGDNAMVPLNGLNRMAGLTFDADFEPDYYITMNCGDSAGTYRFSGHFVTLPTSGGGVSTYLGSTDAAITGSGNSLGIQFAIQNGNASGVVAGCSPAVLLNNTSPTGVEIGVPLSAIGNPGGCIKVCAFINRPAHDFIFNQFMEPLPAGSCDLGDPSTVSLASIAGDQFYVACEEPPTPAVRATWGKVKVLYR